MMLLFHLSLLHLSIILIRTQGLHSEPTCTSQVDVVYKQDGECINQLPSCHIWANQHNYCILNPSFMEEYCPSSCRFCRRVNLGVLKLLSRDDDNREAKSKQVLQRILETSEQHKETYRRYVHDESSSEEQPTEGSSCEEMLSICASIKNQKATSAIFTNQYCTAACESCRVEHHFNLTCPLEEPDTYQVGDMGRVFENITTATGTAAVEIFEKISNDPWLVVIDNFLSDAECDALVLCGTNAGLTQKASYHRSRRSTTALCETQDGIIADLYRRIEELTQVPHVNIEPIQIVKYNPGQFHKMHHDYDDQRKRGHRVLTVLLYLNTVQQGGGTYFPEVKNETIVARKGRAVLWSNGYDSGTPLWKKDKRLVHEDLPVLKGLKYAANIWIHPRQFRIGKTWEDEDKRSDDDLQYAFS